MRSGDKKDNKQDEIRKQYFEIYKKILNFYFSNNNNLGGIISGGGSFNQGNILTILGGMLLFGDFKNNKAVFSAGKGNEYEIKVEFNISEDKKTLHLEVEENEIASKKIKNYKLDLKIPEIPENEVIKFDDNTVRCKILKINIVGLDFKLKDKKIVVVPKNFEPNKVLVVGISLVVQDAEKNWLEVGSVDITSLLDGKKAIKTRRFFEVSEDFRAC